MHCSSNVSPTVNKNISKWLDFQEAQAPGVLSTQHITVHGYET